MKKIISILVILLATNKLIAQNYKFGKISKKELEEKFYPQDSSANAVILYKNRRTYFDYVQGTGFTVVTDVHERIKIYNIEGYDWGTKYIPYYNPESSKSEKVRILDAKTFSLVGGKIEVNKLKKSEIYQEKSNKYWSKKKLTMPNLSEGCIVEWKYRIVSPYKSIEKVQIQYAIPVKKILCKIEIPEYYQFSVKHKGFVQINSVQSTKYSKLVLTQKNRPFIVAPTSFKATDIDYRINVTKIDNSFVPALLEETHVDNIDNYRTAIYYELSFLKWPNEPIKYYSQSWGDVTKTILKESSFGGELSKSNYFKDDLEILVKNSGNKNQLLIAIFAFVKQKVKWNKSTGVFSYNGVRSAYKKGSGSVADINLILTAMLRKASFDANPIILSTRDHGIPIFPTINGFNYVISGVELENKVILFDATSEYSGPNVLPLRTINWQGRIIRDNGSSTWVDLNSPKPSIENRSMNITIDSVGHIEGMQRITYTNMQALDYRDRYSKIKDEAITEKIEEENGLIEISEFKITNKNTIYKPIVETFKFSSEELLDIVGDKIYFKPLLFEAITKNPFKLEKRMYPIDFGTPKSSKNVINISIPKGYQIESIPENLAIALPNKYGVYKFNISTSGNKIIVYSILKIKLAIYPIEYYQEIKEFYKMIVNKNLERVVLKKTKI